MTLKVALLLLSLLGVISSKVSEDNSYIAAVVEYVTPYTPSLSADEVMLYNAHIFVKFMGNASQNKVDIIVFPESGLDHGNAKQYLEVPSPAENIAPCDRNISFHPVLVLLSCASRNFSLYTVVNLYEKYNNRSSNQTEYFNTNVAFDRNGTILGRYRKYNPYGESVNRTAVPEHSYFKTDFNVTFGMFTCFDIQFHEPALTLAHQYGVTHFVFPNCWQSELPFLTAIQIQWGWAFSLDVVLLAAGCNDPRAGGSGSGIYVGARGPLGFSQSNSRASRMIVGQVPIRPDNATVKKWGSEEPITKAIFLDHSTHTDVDVPSQTNSYLAMLRDYLDVYTTESLKESEDSFVENNNSSSNSSVVNLTLTKKYVLCDGNFCCDFKLEVTEMYSTSPPTPSHRGDDFSRFLYRLAVFDGVRSFGGGVATAGLQVCAVIPCLNSSISSCGLRADESTSPIITSLPQYTVEDYYKISTRFQLITIAAEFRYNDTFIFPDVLVTGEGDQFGSLLPVDDVIFEKYEPFNGRRLCTLSTQKNISGLISAALYARQFDKDGEKRTEVPNSVPNDKYSKGYVIMLVMYHFVYFIIRY